MANTINTRIVLRNDELSAWENSEKRLLKGEVAFARLSGELSNNFEMRVGTGTTWSDLSDSNVIVPDSTKFYEKATLTELEAVAGKNGDIGVVKEEIADGKYSYTAYRFDKATNGWVALDGNYSADNVIFSENISAMYTFGKYAGTITKPVSLNTVGKSVATLFSEALQEIKTPTTVKTNPSISIAVTGGGNREIGVTVTMPQATMTFSDGEYEYGPADTGVTVPASKAILKNNQDTSISATNTNVLDNGGTIKTNAQSSKTFVVAEGSKSPWSWSAEVEHTAGVKQYNSINVVSDTAPIIESGKKTATASYSVNGQYPAYYAFTTAPTANPTAITANDGNPTADNGITFTRSLNDFSKTTFATSAKWCELFYLVPASKNTKNWTGINDSSKLPLPVEAKTSATVTLKNGSTVAYSVFVVRNAVAVDGTTCKMTYA